MANKLDDLTGRHFGLLTAQWPAGRRGTRGRTIMWLCLCSCGNLKLVASCNLKSGKILSCHAPHHKLGQKHGHSIGTRGNRTTSPEYNTWASMVQRCTNPSFKDYRYYGGRGITVCQRWKDFRNFLADMGPRPKGKTIDRYPNRDGNYEPGNCRWATQKEQTEHFKRSAKSGRFVCKTPRS